MKHTPEPWGLAGGVGKNGELYVWMKGDYIGGHAIATVHDEMEGAEENARRIVAAVNACSGISTEALEQGGCADPHGGPRRPCEGGADGGCKRERGLAQSEGGAGEGRAVAVGRRANAMSRNVTRGMAARIREALGLYLNGRVTGMKVAPDAKGVYAVQLWLAADAMGRLCGPLQFLVTDAASLAGELRARGMKELLEATAERDGRRARDGVVAGAGFYADTRGCLIIDDAYFPSWPPQGRTA